MSQEYNKDLIKNATAQERKLWYEFLAKYPVRFQRQKVINNFIADFYCAKARLIIELDGSGHYEETQEKYDIKRTEILQTYGLKVLRFTNLDVNNNFYGVCTVIDNEVKNYLPQSSADDSSLKEEANGSQNSCAFTRHENTSLCEGTIWASLNSHFKKISHHCFLLIHSLSCIAFSNI